MSRAPDYLTCTESWCGTKDRLVLVLDATANRIGSFPIEFLQNGAADTATVEYLMRICKLVLDIPVTFRLVISDTDGPLSKDVCIVPGIYRINGTFANRSGPSGKTKSKPFRDTDSSSTVSKSSRSTANQSHFKMELLARDGECLLTGEDVVESLVACHIIPFSLGQEKLDEICDPLTIGSFSVTNGLLLSPSLHVNFDRYLWGIYTYEGSHFVHVFGENYHELHGKRIEYRARKKNRLPNVSLLEWQYSQCLMARFRGFMVKSETI